MTKQSRRVTTTFQAHSTQTLPPVPLEWHVNTATSLYQTSIVFPMCNDHISCSPVNQLHTDMGQIMIVAKWLHGRSPTDLQTQLSRSQLWRGGKTTNSHDRTTQVHLSGTKYIHTYTVWPFITSRWHNPQLVHAWKSQSSYSRMHKGGLHWLSPSAQPRMHSARCHFKSQTYRQEYRALHNYTHHATTAAPVLHTYLHTYIQTLPYSRPLLGSPDSTSHVTKICMWSNTTEPKCNAWANHIDLSDYYTSPSLIGDLTCTLLPGQCNALLVSSHCATTRSSHTLWLWLHVTQATHY